MINNTSRNKNEWNLIRVESFPGINPAPGRKAYLVKNEMVNGNFFILCSSERSKRFFLNEDYYYLEAVQNHQLLCSE